MYQNPIHLGFMRSVTAFALFVISSSILFGQRQDSVSRKQNVLLRNFTAPVVFIGLGLYTKQSGSVLSRFDVKGWRDKTCPNFSHHADDVLQFVPMGLVYGLDLAGVKTKNDLLNRSILLVKTEIMVNGLIQLLKHATDIKRPDGSNYHSFPSGHTAQAFAAATFMHKELGHHSIWYSVGAYTMASTVGAFRVLNDKHWISDVLAGAGIGILSTNMAYLTHRYKWGKRPGLVLVPSYSNGPMLFASITFAN
jgi:membrane-associated phospholipid phosphatase